MIDAQHDPRLYHGVDLVTGITTHDLLAVPLITHQGTVGVIEAVNSRGPQPFSEDDLAFLEALAGSIAVAIENARLYAQVRESEANLRTRVGVLRRDLARTDVFSKMIGATPPMQEVYRLMESAAASSIPVLIEGETGTGKELVARGIHMASARSEGPFVAINCASLPETLLESELFGHRRGAFTGAVRDNPGLFRAAQRRGDFPRRNLRHADEHAGQVVARARGGGSCSGWRHVSAQSGRKSSVGHQSGPES